MSLTAIHTNSTGASFFDRTHTASEEEIERGLSASAKLRSRIIKHFELHPGDEISPSEFKERYGLQNPIHGVRPRFCELAKTMDLVRTDTKVPSGQGGYEHRYRRFVVPGEQISMF